MLKEPINNIFIAVYREAFLINFVNQAELLDNLESEINNLDIEVGFQNRKGDVKI